MENKHDQLCIWVEEAQGQSTSSQSVPDCL